MGSGFRVQGLGFRVQGSGFRVQGLGLRVAGSGDAVVWGSGVGVCAVEVAPRRRDRGQMSFCFCEGFPQAGRALPGGFQELGLWCFGISC